MICGNSRTHTPWMNWLALWLRTPPRVWTGFLQIQRGNAVDMQICNALSSYLCFLVMHLWRSRHVGRGQRTSLAPLFIKWDWLATIFFKKFRHLLGIPTGFYLRKLPDKSTWYVYLRKLPDKSTWAQLPEKVTWQKYLIKFPGNFSQVDNGFVSQVYFPGNHHR